MGVLMFHMIPHFLELVSRPTQLRLLKLFGEASFCEEERSLLVHT